MRELSNLNMQEYLCKHKKKDKIGKKIKVVYLQNYRYASY